MKRELFHIGSLTIYGYGLMIAIAIYSAYFSVEYRAKKKGLEYQKIFDLTIWCAIGGILGAKILYYITVIPDIIKDPSILLDISNGFVVYGGIIFGILAGSIYCIRQKWNFFQYFDLVMPSIALAQGFGRIGCLLAGCCYGKKTDSWFSITFHEPCLAPNDVPLIPTQIISSGLDFLNFFVLILIAKRNKVNGLVGGCYLMFYSAGRFILEFFRGDLDRGNVGSLSTSQFISLFLFLIGAGIVIVRILYVKKSGLSELVTAKEPKEENVEEDDSVEEYDNVEEDENIEDDDSVEEDETLDE